MKKIIYFIALLPLLIKAQTVSENYTQKTIYRIPTTSLITNLVDSIATVQIVYFDGLGRPIQKIANKQSNSGKDIITHIEYDQFGRQQKDYLPYVSTTNNLAYDTNALLNTMLYADATSGGLSPTNYNGNNPYSQKFFEASPLNLILKIAAPGIPWIGHDNDDNDHTIKFDYQTNDIIEVKKFNVITNWNVPNELYEPTLIDDGFYGQNELYKTITKNENWVNGNGTNNTTEEFKDKEGRIILKKTYNDGAYETYYVYDVYGNLTYVIPPKVEIANGIDTVVIESLCYQYKYDYRNRLVEKKLPGKQWEYIIYDKLDQVVATGPALSPFGGIDQGWLITKYEVLGRVAYTGWYPENNFDSLSRKNFQDNYTLSNIMYEVIKNKTIDGVLINYSNNVFPTVGMTLLTVSYYDDYGFPNAPTPSGTIYGKSIAANVKGLPTGSWVRMLTTAAEHLATTSFIFYDDKKFRPIQTTSSNYLGGFTTVKTKYNFSGQVLETSLQHKMIQAAEPVTVVEQFTYTAQGRLLNHLHKINSNPKELIAHNEYDELGKLIRKNAGGSDITTFSGLQKVDYAYNIRGWLKSINDINHLIKPNEPKDLFAFKINYNEVENDVNGQVKELYNGNISETFWRTASDNTKRKYGYQYDALNRLTNSFYQKPNLPNEYTNNYNESLSYDKNGNIMSLQRNGASDEQYMPLQIDDLTYTYSGNSNQLLTVTDATIDPNGFKDDNSSPFQEDSTDYQYDANGNMNVDQNKGITEILYNHLNLPTKITFGTTGTINYFYNAIGQKLKKVVEDNTGSNLVTTRTDYLDGFQYKNLGLQFFPTAEGYVTILENVNGTKDESIYIFKYVYNYLDHLGNIRLSYAQDPSNGVLRIIEENHYYPFGLKHTNYNSNVSKYAKEEEVLKIIPVPPLFRVSFNYKYNGKELQEELGLNNYDYGARNYDPAIGRWMNIDPLAETSRRISPYVYALNNPIYFIDPDGMDEEGWGSRDYEGTDFYDPGWIENKTNHGIHYEKDIRSQQDLIDRGRGDEKFICNECEYPRYDGHIWGLFDSPDNDTNHQWVRDTENTNSDSGTINDKISESENNDVIDLDIYFESSSSKLDRKQEDLKELYIGLEKNHDVNIQILGNFSSDPSLVNPKTTAISNGVDITVEKLQLERAKSIRRFLISNGINHNRISIGNGKIENGATSASIKIIK